MAQMSNYLENQLVNHVLRGIAFNTPGTVYLALYSTDPGEDDTGTELSVNGYARQSMLFGSPTDGQTSNGADIVFPAATADWDAVTHIGFRDAITGGNLLMHQALDASVLILLNNNFRIPIGDLDVSFA